MSSHVDALESSAEPRWRWLCIGEALLVDSEHDVVLHRRSKRSWTVAFRDVAGLTVDYGRPTLSVYKHKPKDQRGGPFIISGIEREIVPAGGKVSFGQLKPAVLSAMKILILQDVVPRLTGKTRP